MFSLLIKTRQSSLLQCFFFCFVCFSPLFFPPHLANDEDVGEPGSEAVARAVLDVHHVEGAGVTLPVGDHTDTPQVSTAGHHAQVTYGNERER